MNQNHSRLSSVIKSIDGKSTKSPIQKKPRVSNNFHTGFVDLNRDYLKRKYIKPQNLANHWIKSLGEKLKARIEIEENKKFIEFINNGGRLEANEIKKLSEYKKKEYTQVILKEIGVDQGKIDKILAEVSDKQDEIIEIMWGLKDTQDTWDEAVD